MARAAGIGIRGGGLGSRVTDLRDDRIRCPWATSGSESDRLLMCGYHDHEWGRPLRGRVAMFERMTLEAFQSGLSWLVILRKRDNFRRAFAGFDIETVAGYTERDVARLMADAGIVRNRAKIEAAIANARAAASWMWTCRSCCGPTLRRRGDVRPLRPRCRRRPRSRLPWRTSSSAGASDSSARPRPMR